MKSRNTAWTDPSFEQITETFIHEYLEERKTLVSQPVCRPAGRKPEHTGISEKGRPLEDVVRELKGRSSLSAAKPATPGFWALCPVQLPAIPGLETS